MTPWYFRLFVAFIFFSPDYILYWWRHFLKILKAFFSVTRMYRWFTWITSKVKTSKMKTVEDNKAHVEDRNVEKLKWIEVNIFFVLTLASLPSTLISVSTFYLSTFLFLDQIQVYRIDVFQTPKKIWLIFQWWLDDELFSVVLKYFY